MVNNEFRQWLHHQQINTRTNKQTQTSIFCKPLFRIVIYSFIYLFILYNPEKPTEVRCYEKGICQMLVQREVLRIKLYVHVLFFREGYMKCVYKYLKCLIGASNHKTCSKCWKICVKVAQFHCKTADMAQLMETENIK